MAQGDADVGDRTQVISLERRRCVTTQRHMRHTARIIENLNLAPREIIQRERERRTPQKITPRFKERLFAGPFGGQMDSFAIVFLACAVRRLPYLAHGKQSTHMRARLSQLFSECGHIHHVMPQTKCVHGSHCPPLRAQVPHSIKIEF